MTLPTVGPEATPERLAGKTTNQRERRGLLAACGVLGLSVLCLVYVFPSLATPLATASGVVAVALPVRSALGKTSGEGQSHVPERESGPAS